MFIVRKTWLLEFLSVTSVQFSQKFWTESGRLSSERVRALWGRFQSGFAGWRGRREPLCGLAALGALVLMFSTSSWALEMEGGTTENIYGKLTWHGYGELHYNSPKGSSVPKDGDPAIMDFHRLVWGLAYHWNDQISLHTEIDFEHAVNASDLELEYAYIDFLVTPAINFRMGAVLMPVGPLNEFHEPPLFYSVERPYVQRTIIPTTWQEGGLGIFGSPFNGALKYRLYYVSSLDASKFTADDGIRKGRGKLKEAKSDDKALVGRIEFVAVPGLTLGGSGYKGGGNIPDVEVSILEGDLRYRIGGLDIQGVYATIDVDEAQKITATSAVGSKMVGWTTEVAYHFLPLLYKNTGKDMVLFARWEELNTQKEVASGATADPKNDREVFTYGVAYYPIADIAVKTDLENWKSAAGERDRRLNIGLAYMF